MLKLSDLANSEPTRTIEGSENTEQCALPHCAGPDLYSAGVCYSAGDIACHIPALWRVPRCITCLKTICRFGCATALYIELFGIVSLLHPN